MLKQSPKQTAIARKLLRPFSLTSILSRWERRPLAPRLGVHCRLQQLRDAPRPRC